MRIFSLLILLLFFNEVYSQDQLAEYRRAKTLMEYGNYKDAMELLRPYMEESDFGALSYYAKYHFAYSAFKNNQIELVKSVLQPLLEVQSFNKKDEVKYLLALAYFKEENYLNALQEIETILDESIFSEAEKASYNYLQNVSVSFLVSNLSKFQRNSGYLLVLKEQLEKQSLMSSDEKLVYQKLRNISTGEPVVENNKNMQVLDIAMVLPFNYSGGSGVQSFNSGNFVFELFQGINFALKEFKNKGVKINVKTFDTQRDLDKLRNILVDPFMQQVDLIIGPIYPDETEIVMAFAEKNNVPFVNPLSNIDDRLGELEFAYLFRPSVSSLSNALIEYLRKNVEGKRLAIAYSNTVRDEQLAKKIAESSERFGYVNMFNRQVSNKDINRFFDDTQLRYDSLSKADVIVILSDDPNIASSTFGFMESQNIKVPVVVLDSWLNFNFASYEMLESQNFVFLGNNTMNFNSEYLIQFRTDFYKKHLIYPSSNAHLGYELIYWIVETINPSKGFDFRKNLNQRGYQSGRISYGFDFTNSFNNRYVPILELESGILKTK
ncbi:ABC-type branched-chain amino acid transport system, substrate-binding protein [Aquiflexum balticum DSM 16537]|uniref:ABC-type branched-chain amino acid transport system, substrate-binding protein n=1 Tax=Aquiflexum balticum DSM 16537 TaxID=758820 RepID=A0A1W2HBY2_9BACT|nr:ABC transporter substrate-binding protein [Aquiflexum balticum]SMD46379.1 ABC-type branched-chain amino acid transport system, substrate-binding protein [Aquiflexum balticum DSM 16537]